MQEGKGLDVLTCVRYCEHMETAGFGLRLRRVRESLGVGLRELHRRTGIGLSTLQQWESGKRWAGKAPPGDDIKRIEIALGVPVGSLLSGQAEDKVMETPARVVLPRHLTEQELYERFGIKPYDEPQTAEGIYLSAGSGKGVPQGIDDTITRKVKGRKYLWEAPVVGDCMMDEIKPGEVVIYSTRLEPLIGKVMVALRGEEELLIKRLMLDRQGMQVLRPNRGEDVPVDETIRFLGRGVSVQRALL